MAAILINHGMPCRSNWRSNPRFAEWQGDSMSARQSCQCFAIKRIPLSGREMRRAQLREIKKQARTEKDCKKGAK